MDHPVFFFLRLCRLLTSIELGTSSHVLTLWTVSHWNFSDTGSRVVEMTHDGCQVSRRKVEEGNVEHVEHPIADLALVLAGHSWTFSLLANTINTRSHAP